MLRWHYLFIHDTEKLNKDYQYILEFKFPSKTHHLIPCDNYNITLIGIRNSKTLKEENIDIESPFNFLKKFKFNNIDELNNYIINLDPIKSEGLVYCSNNTDLIGNYTRFKIKTPQFELISLLRTLKQEDSNKEKERIRLNTKWLKEISLYNYHTSFLELDKFNSFKEEYLKMLESKKVFEQECIKYSHLSKQELAKADIPQEIKTFLFLKLKK